MTRTKGSRNKDFESSRNDIVAALRTHLRAHPREQPSFRHLAALAGVSVPTLRHYFAGTSDVLRAVMKQFRADGEPYVHAAATQVPDDLAVSLTAFAVGFAKGWSFGAGAIHHVGLVAGLGEANMGPTYLDELLEPTVQAFESRLAIHAARGTFPVCDFRFAALAFVSPVFVALLHQDVLGGRTCRALELDEFLREHVARFVKAWGPPPGPR